MSTCRIEQCESKLYARSLCKIHYYRLTRTGTTDVAPRYDLSRSVEDRFMGLVDTSGLCWLWLGTKTKEGYPQFRYCGTAKQAHRVAHELFIGEIPSGYEVDHLCNVPSCVNPSHLEAVPPHVNNLRSNSASAVNSRKTRCKRGHEFTPENTYKTPATEWRQCRMCRREHQRKAA